MYSGICNTTYLVLDYVNLQNLIEPSCANMHVCTCDKSKQPHAQQTTIGGNRRPASHWLQLGS